ncbi:MAG: hypothetical protein AB1489_39440 [Acidobacteriota bacterium]
MVESEREVKLEIVDYDEQEILNTTIHLLRNFAVYSGISGTSEWLRALVNLREIIENTLPFNYELQSCEGLSLVFLGFKMPIPVARDGELIYKAREPRFVFEEDTDLLNAGRRGEIEKVNRQIADEMSQSYALSVQEDPLTLIFPNEYYAKSVTVFSAEILPSSEHDY